MIEKLKIRIAIILTVIGIQSIYLGEAYSKELLMDHDRQLTCDSLHSELGGDTAFDFFSYMNESSFVVLEGLDGPTASVTSPNIDVLIMLLQNMRVVTQCMLTSGLDSKLFLNSFQKGNYKKLFHDSLEWTHSLRIFQEKHEEYLICSIENNEPCDKHLVKSTQAMTVAKALVSNIKPSIDSLSEEFSLPEIYVNKKRPRLSCNHNYLSLIEAIKSLPDLAERASIIYNPKNIPAKNDETRILAEVIAGKAKVINCVPYVLLQQNMSETDSADYFYLTPPSEEFFL